MANESGSLGKVVRASLLASLAVASVVAASEGHPERAVVGKGDRTVQRKRATGNSWHRRERGRVEAHERCQGYQYDGCKRLAANHLHLRSRGLILLQGPPGSPRFTPPGHYGAAATSTVTPASAMRQWPAPATSGLGSTSAETTSCAVLPP